MSLNVCAPGSGERLGFIADARLFAVVNLGVPDIAAHIRGSCHEAEANDGQNQNESGVPCRQSSRSTPQPQTKPGEKSGELHEKERHERSAFMCIDKSRWQVRRLDQLLLRVVSADIGRDGHRSSQEKYYQTHALKRMVLAEERGNE